MLICEIKRAQIISEPFALYIFPSLYERVYLSALLVKAKTEGVLLLKERTNLMDDTMLLRICLNIFLLAIATLMVLLSIQAFNMYLQMHKHMNSPQKNSSDLNDPAILCDDLLYK